MSEYQAVLAHLVRDNYVLLGRNLSRGLWTTFGGKPEGNETIEETLERELAEELGIVPTVTNRLPDRSRNWFGEEARIAVFAVTSWEGTPQNLAAHEHAEIRWFSVEELELVEITEQAKQEAEELLGAERGQPIRAEPTVEPAKES